MRWDVLPAIAMIWIALICLLMSWETAGLIFGLVGASWILAYDIGTSIWKRSQQKKA